MTDGVKPGLGCLAFLAAPVAAAALAAAIAIVLSFDDIRTGSAELTGLAAFMFTAAFVVAGLHTVVLAVPLYYLLQRHLRPTLVVILASGALIGVLPITLLTILTGDGEDSMMVIAPFGLLGLFGAFAFWAVIRLERR